MTFISIDKAHESDMEGDYDVDSIATWIQRESYPRECYAVKVTMCSLKDAFSCSIPWTKGQGATLFKLCLMESATGYLVVSTVPFHRF